VYKSLLFTVLAAAIPAVALAQATPAPVTPGPIQIDSCDVKNNYAQESVGFLAFNGHQSQGFIIKFTNTAKSPATNIVWQVDFASSRYILGDAGNFAPNDPIQHILRNYGKSVKAEKRPASEGTTTTQCTVLSATFADGSTWAAPAASP
jgi:hypothetical protein